VKFEIPFGLKQLGLILSNQFSFLYAIHSLVHHFTTLYLSEIFWVMVWWLWITNQEI